MPSKFIRRCMRGDVFRAEMAAAGGYGDPLERDAEAVAEDVRQEKMSVTHAQHEYGVVFAPGGTEVDREATRRLRARA